MKLKDINVQVATVVSKLGRLYRPGMSFRGMTANIVDYVGNMTATLVAAGISLVIFLISLTLFAFWFALVFSIVAALGVFVIAKLLFYQPKSVTIELDDEKTVLSFVKEVNLNGESEIVIHSQPGYGKEKNTFLIVQLLDTFSVLDCRNITSIVDVSYDDLAIRFFHPVEGEYRVELSSDEGPVGFEVLQQTADNCRVKLLKPLRKVVQIDFSPT